MASLIPWYEREVCRLRNELDTLFDELFARDPFLYSLKDFLRMPAVDVSETGKEIFVHAEIPGMDVKDLEISLNGRVLTIKGEKKREQEEREKNYHRLERKYGSFFRSIELPADVNAEKVKATYKNGMLELHLFKAEEQSIRKVDVKSS